MTILDDIDRLMARVMPVNRYGSRLLIAPGALSAFIRAFGPVIPEPDSIDRFAGLPVVESDQVRPGQYRVLDQFGETLNEGTFMLLRWAPLSVEFKLLLACWRAAGEWPGSGDHSPLRQELSKGAS